MSEPVVRTPLPGWSHEELLYETVDEGKIAIITMNRPDKLNAMTQRMLAEIRHALAAAEGDEGLFDTVVSIDPNLEHSTCVLTSRFAKIDPTNTDNVLEVLSEVGVMYTSLDDWVMIYDHLVSMID